MRPIYAIIKAIKNARQRKRVERELRLKVETEQKINLERWRIRNRTLNDPK